MALECQVCGRVYGWEMFFHQHLRDVHDISAKGKAKPMRMNKQNMDLLEGYFNHTCQHPSLEQIELLVKLMDLKKETVYWWFVNRNKKQKQKLLENTAPAA